MPDFDEMTLAALEKHAQKLMAQRDDLRDEQLRVKAAIDKKREAAQAEELLAGMTEGQKVAIARAARAEASASAKTT